LVSALCSTFIGFKQKAKGLHLVITVLLVDDHDLVRAGVKSLLQNIVGIKVIAEASTGEEAVKIAREKHPNVVLMDVRMPGIGGLEATRKLLRADPNLKVIALTVCGEEPFPSKLLQAGAAGYLTKGSGIDEMVQAIHAVYSGKRYISPEVAHQLALKHLSDDNISPFESLSERELQVMLMITSGQKVQDISDKLCLSPKTVNSYRYRLFEKLGVHSDVELTHLAIRHGMLDTELNTA
jgi:two-component system invasion response regulator UvrY